MAFVAESKPGERHARAFYAAREIGFSGHVGDEVAEELLAAAMRAGLPPEGPDQEAQ
jgi:hypothetical protein